MKSLRLWACGIGLAVAATLVVASPQAFAKEGDGFRPIASAYTFDCVSNFGNHVAARSDFVLPADHSAIATGYNCRVDTVLIDKAKTPARYGSAILATTQAGWRSGRLRKLSAG